jgi:hypothetical protein
MGSSAIVLENIEICRAGCASELACGCRKFVRGQKRIAFSGSAAFCDVQPQHSDVLQASLERSSGLARRLEFAETPREEADATCALGRPWVCAFAFCREMVEARSRNWLLV